MNEETTNKEGYITVQPTELGHPVSEGFQRFINNIKLQPVQNEDVEREDDPDFDRDREAEDLAQWEDDSNEM